MNKTNDFTMRPGTSGKRVTKDTIPRVLELIAMGKSLRQIGRVAGMPKADTITGWLRCDEGFAMQYARAKAQAMDAMAEDILAIADEGETREITLADGTTKVVFDGAAVQRNRLRVDTRKWLMSKLAPKKYGERLDVHATTEVKSLSDEELAERLAAFGVHVRGIGDDIGG